MHIHLSSIDSAVALLYLSLFIPVVSYYTYSCMTLYIEQFFFFPNHGTAAAAKSRQSCPTLCDPIDSSPPGSPVPGILQARTLEWVAISFSSAGKWKVKVKLLSRVRLFTTPWTVAYQAPPSMGFPRQEYWSGFAIAFSCLRMSRYQIFILFHSPTIN